MLYLICLLPVVCFLLVMVQFDSFSLTKKEFFVYSFISGVVLAGLNVLIRMFIPYTYSAEVFFYPIIIEVMCGLAAMFIVKLRKSPFFIDSFLYGVGIGAGFAFIENLRFVITSQNLSIENAVIQGFGYAMIQCTTVAITALLISRIYVRKDSDNYKVVKFSPLLIIPAIVIHIVYEFGFTHIPSLTLLLSTMIFIVVIDMIVLVINEKYIEKWLEHEMYTDVELLSCIRRGEYPDSKAGAYLSDLKEHFKPVYFEEMQHCVELYLELSISAKSNFILSNTGFSSEVGNDIKEKLKEFDILQKKIGKSKMFALRPIIKNKALDAWKIAFLEQCQKNN